MKRECLKRIVAHSLSAFMIISTIGMGLTSICMFETQEAFAEDTPVLTVADEKELQEPENEEETTDLEDAIDAEVPQEALDLQKAPDLQKASDSKKVSDSAQSEAKDLEEEGSVSYAVQVYFTIDQDEDGTVDALEFGPAVGVDARTPEGAGSLCDSDHCIHTDSWAAIASHPERYAACKEAGCTKAVELDTSNSVFSTEAASMTTTGDGVGVLSNEILSANRIWDGGVFATGANGKYEWSEIKRTLDTLRNAFPADLKKTIASKDITYIANNEIYTMKNAYIYLLSRDELTAAGKTNKQAYAYGDGYVSWLLRDTVYFSKTGWQCYSVSQISGLYVALNTPVNNSNQGVAPGFRIAKKDLEPPLINAQDMEVELGTELDDVWDRFSATDEVDGDVNVSWESGEYKKYKPGDYQITLTARDSAGNVATKTVTITVKPGEGTLSYAVQVYKIDSKGIEFGPATGVDTRTPSGGGHLCDSDHCIHTDSWETIAQNPRDYEDCKSAGCTKAVELDPSQAPNVFNDYASGLGTTGDGVSALELELHDVFYGLVTDEPHIARWNEDNGDFFSGKYEDSKIQTTLSELLEAFPGDLKDVIVEKNISYEVSIDPGVPQEGGNANQGNETYHLDASLYLLSMDEVTAAGKTTAESRTAYTRDGEIVSWWLRDTNYLFKQGHSPILNKKGAGRQVKAAISDQDPYLHWAAATAGTDKDFVWTDVRGLAGIAPGFRIGEAEDLNPSTDPLDPTDPSNPSDPANPSNPSDPANPSNPSTQQDGSSSGHSPKSGDSVFLNLWMLLLLMSTGGLLVITATAVRNRNQ